MRIGNVSIAHPITLAPMEEHTNYPFRLLCKQLGASLVCGERVDGSDVAKRDRRALKLLHTTPTEKPAVGQISGNDPHVMAEAAKVVAEQGFSIVDLNFECPIRRLIGRGEGGALMADPPAIARLVTKWSSSKWWHLKKKSSRSSIRRSSAVWSSSGTRSSPIRTD